MEKIFGKMKRSKKGFIGGPFGIAISLVLGFVIFAFIVSVFADMLTTSRGTQTANTYAYNATTNGLEGINSLSKQLPSIGLIIVIVVILAVIGMIGMYAYNKTR